jgi:hypothetical protein
MEGQDRDQREGQTMAHEYIPTNAELVNAEHEAWAVAEAQSTHAWAVSVQLRTADGASYWHAEITEAWDPGVTTVRDYYVDWSAAQVAADMLSVATKLEGIWPS